MAGDFGVKQVAIPGVSNGVGELRDSIKDMTNLVFQQKNMRLQEEANNRANATTQASIANDNTRTGMAMYSLARDTMKENRELATKTASNYVLNTLYSSDKLGSAVDADSKRKELLSNPLMAGLFDPTVVKEVSTETQRRAGDAITNYKTNFKEPDPKFLNDPKYIANFYKDPKNLKADADPEYVLATGLASAGTDVKVKNSVFDFSNKKKEDLQNDFKEVLNNEKFKLDKLATKASIASSNASTRNAGLQYQMLKENLAVAKGEKYSPEQAIKELDKKAKFEYLKANGADVSSLIDSKGNFVGGETSVNRIYDKQIDRDKDAFKNFPLLLEKIAGEQSVFNSSDDASVTQIKAIADEAMKNGAPMYKVYESLLTSSLNNKKGLMNNANRVNLDTFKSYLNNYVK
jgi:hypothetical protein